MILTELQLHHKEIRRRIFNFPGKKFTVIAARAVKSDGPENWMKHLTSSNKENPQRTGLVNE